MEKFYCIECKNNFDKSEAQSKFKPAFQWNGYSLRCYKFWEYRCMKCLGKCKIKSSKGFIQIPILIAIIVGILVLGSTGYFGIRQYQNHQAQKARELEAKQKEQKLEQDKSKTEQQTRDLEIKNLKKEVDALKNQKPQVIIKENPPVKTPDLSAIIQEWRPKIARVVCRWDYSNGAYDIGAGSGTVMIESNVYVVTNKHVITNEQGYAANSCTVTLPGHAQQYFSKPNSILVAKNNIDMGTIDISNPDQYIRGIAVIGNKYDSKWCQEKAQLGEGVVILGYPSIGSQEGTTVTEGIISGYDRNYYITSAKVEHGNSGGIAISVPRNCYIGIPSYAVTGSVESLSRILDAKASF